MLAVIEVLMFRVLTALSVLFFAVGSAAASEGHGAHQPSFSDLLVFWVNFAIYLAILYFLLRGVLRRAWARRRENIETAVSGSLKELGVAEQALAQAEMRLASIESESSRLAREIAADTEHECKALLAQAAAKSQKIADRARQTVQAEERSASNALQREAAELALQLAAQKFQRELTAQSDRALRERALSGLGRLMQ